MTSLVDLHRKSFSTRSTMPSWQIFLNSLTNARLVSYFSVRSVSLLLGSTLYLINLTSRDAFSSFTSSNQFYSSWNLVNCKASVPKFPDLLQETGQRCPLQVTVMEEPRSSGQYTLQFYVPTPLLPFLLYLVTGTELMHYLALDSYYLDVKLNLAEACNLHLFHQYTLQLSRKSFSLLLQSPHYSLIKPSK